MITIDKLLKILILNLILIGGCQGNENPIGGPRPGPPKRNYGGPIWGPTDLIIFRHTPSNADSAGLWLIKADGTAMRPYLLTRIDGDFDHPDWSPDGQWLALDSDGQIYKIRVTGDGLEQLTSGPIRKFYPTWSPDGQQIAFSINDGPHNVWGIWTVAADGQETQHIAYHLTSTDSVNAAVNPDWSSSYKIIFSGWPPGSQKQKLILMDDSGANAKILFDPGFYGYDYGVDHSQFSPDASKIVFQTNPTETRDPQIWVVDTDGRHPRLLTTDGGLEPSWSPDGRQIVFVKYSWRHPEQPGNGKLWIMEADGRNKRQLTF